MNQYFKRQLKTPTCFGSSGIHPQGVLKCASLKLPVMFRVCSRCLAARNLDWIWNGTSNLYSIVPKLLTWIRNMSEFLIVF